ncbi:EAL domain-containing protein [[Clostridium] hylemonae]
MHLESGRYKAVEALVRLPDGKGGYFPAGQVISLAERNAMVEALGDYVLANACSFMREWGEELGVQRMGINLSVQQLLVGNSAEHLLQLISAANVEPGRITLEITESILIQSIDHAAETLEKLRKAGIHIALDDFGVGYSSLNYLSNLPVDIIKIDRSLTQQILTNEKQYALLRSIVDMSVINDLSVVAEGVESGAEQKMIASAGVQYIQGYYYARPMPGEELIVSLKGRQG